MLIATTAAYAFRDRRVIAFHVALIAVAMATAMLLRDQLSSQAVALTVVLILTVATMSALIAYLRTSSYSRRSCRRR
ncbi:MAG: hypothetical protein M3Y09_14175 [Actinomycetota bacterium]|nr:hypothetical protein [Actinomycetota bacterium]